LRNKTYRSRVFRAIEGSLPYAGFMQLQFCRPHYIGCFPVGWYLSILWGPLDVCLLAGWSVRLRMHRPYEESMCQASAGPAGSLLAPCVLMAMWDALRGSVGVSIRKVWLLWL